MNNNKSARAMCNVCVKGKVCECVKGEQPSSQPLRGKQFFFLGDKQEEKKHEQTKGKFETSKEVTTTERRVPEREGTTKRHDERKKN